MPQLMGIVNLTPDSFWEQSRFSNPASAFDRMLELYDDGASIADIGAVSSRPGAPEVPMEEEWKRLKPFLSLFGGNVPSELRISIDTTRSEIVRRSFDLIGNFIVNDISAGQDDPRMLGTVAELGLTYIAMHRRGDSRSMDSLTSYPRGVLREVSEFFSSFGEQARKEGVCDWILDPGFGFAKNDGQNLELLEHLSDFKVFGRPILAGISDKRFTSGRQAELYRKLVGQGADILRVHDVKTVLKYIN